jgi:ABC-type lipoprotein export system ATPase subunit
MSGNPRGSLWNKWDLHVHTPASIVQVYGGDNEVAWEKFFVDIESLPQEFKVIGINDYIFIDGYKKVLQAHKSGRMQNIRLFLPVIELRLDKFGQSGDKLSCVNYHIIFSNEVTPEEIQIYFLNTLSTIYKPTSSESSEFQVMAIRESLINCGQQIQLTTPENKRLTKSDLEIGFNNFHLSVEKISNALKSLCFQSKYLTAVGKAEWEDIRWGESGQGAAEKKTIVNKVDFLFTAAKTIEAALKSKTALTLQGVNDLLFDCSDAHHFSDHADDKVRNRIGKCFTWIKADLTFEGLKMALNEAEERSYIGEEPDIIGRVKANKTKYIQSISIKKVDDSSLNEAWFDNINIPFNHGLITIIGNKGNGKSALTDIIAMLSNHPGGFSFLNSDKFCNRKDNKAKDFEACLTWEDGSKTPLLRLDSKAIDAAAVKVKYIPQDFFERVCNETDVSIKSEFGKELKNVIFSHVPYVERNSCDSLDDLINHRTSEIKISLDTLRAQLKEICRNIVAYENYVSEEYSQDIIKKLNVKQQELNAHKQNQPSGKDKPETNTDLQTDIENLQEQIESLARNIQILETELTTQNNLKIQINKAFLKLANFQVEYEKLKHDWNQSFNLIELEVTELVKLVFGKDKLESKQQQCLIRISEINQEIETKRLEKADIEVKIKSKKDELNEPEKIYQKYLADVQEWQIKENMINGTSNEPNSISYYNDLLDKSKNTVPLQLGGERIKRLNISKEIFRLIQKLSDFYKELYKPVQEFVTNESLKKDYKLTFEVSIIIYKFQDKFFEYINQSVKGTFRGSAEGLAKLSELIEVSEFQQEQNIETFLDEVISRLEFEDKQQDRPVKIVNQLKQSKNLEDFYYFLFSLEYLEPTYTLKLRNNEIKLLSPGERGALLLIFYLLVDKSDIPIIIDQPEHNLDSESVYELLLRCVRKAKKRRQVFMITHNPNLAVVCDAEQVIHSAIDKEKRNLVTYTTGSLENSEINKRVINVLEGTLPAFNNRESKYKIHS